VLRRAIETTAQTGQVEYRQNPLAKRAEAESFQAPPKVPRTTPATVKSQATGSQASDPTAAVRQAGTIRLIRIGSNNFKICSINYPVPFIYAG